MGALCVWLTGERVVLGICQGSERLVLFLASWVCICWLVRCVLGD